jgi:hypothetical protein
MQNIPYQQPTNALLPTANQPNYWVKGVMTVIFGLVTFYSVSFYFPQPSSQALSATGKITGYHETEDFPLPTFSFQDKKGQTHSVDYPIPFSELIYPLNKSIEVIYDPSNPSQARIQNDPIYSNLNFLAQIFGGYFIFTGLLMIFLKLKNLPQQIITTLIRGITGFTYGILALSAYPLLDYFLGHHSSIIPPQYLTEIRQTLPWIASIISISGFLIIVLTIVFVRKSLLKYVPPTI